jgi:hypothetical protein
MTSAFDVVIVNFETRHDLLACLGSMLDTRPAALAEVFVVDNASTDGSADAVRAARPSVHVIALDRNAGFAAANNIAIRRATAPLVLLLNPDTLVSPGALDRLASRLEATGATAAGPRLVDAQGRPEVSCGRMLSPFAEIAHRRRVRRARRGTPADLAATERLLGRERDVDWVSGACLLVRRDAALAAGLLDERYFLYEEDVDFCAALRSRGGRILFTPAAEVVHLRGRSAAAPGAASLAWYDRSHVAFYEKHAPAWAPLLRWWLRLRGRAVE